MSLELIYTSAPRGLKPGSRGFCTVACTRGVSQQIIERLETLSGYRNLFATGDPNAKLNPVSYSHLIIALGGRRYHVLSRIGDAGLDYTQRTNKFAHHVALDSAELPLAGPAWLLSVPGFLRSRWEGEPEWLPQIPSLPRGESPLAVCRAWQRLTGDAGWGGVLAESVASANRPATIIFPPGLETLPLLVESLALLPAELRWNVTFSTYFTTLPAGVACQWRCLADNTPEAAAARREAQTGTLIDLCHTLPPAMGSHYVEAARTGRMSPLHSTFPPPIALPDSGNKYLADEQLAFANGGQLSATDAKFADFSVSPTEIEQKPPRFQRHDPKLKSAPRWPWIVATCAILLLLAAGGAIWFAKYHNNDESTDQNVQLSIDEARSKIAEFEKSNLETNKLIEDAKRTAEALESVCIEVKASLDSKQQITEDNKGSISDTVNGIEETLRDSNTILQNASEFFEYANVQIEHRARTAIDDSNSSLEQAKASITKLNKERTNANAHLDESLPENQSLRKAIKNGLSNLTQAEEAVKNAGKEIREINVNKQNLQNTLAVAASSVQSSKEYTKQLQIVRDNAEQSRVRLSWSLTDASKNVVLAKIRADTSLGEAIDAKRKAESVYKIIKTAEKPIPLPECITRNEIGTLFTSFPITQLPQVSAKDVEVFGIFDVFQDHAEKSTWINNVLEIKYKNDPKDALAGQPKPFAIAQFSYSAEKFSFRWQNEAGGQADLLRNCLLKVTIENAREPVYIPLRMPIKPKIVYGVSRGKRINFNFCESGGEIASEIISAGKIPGHKTFADCQLAITQDKMPGNWDPRFDVSKKVCEFKIPRRTVTHQYELKIEEHKQENDSSPGKDIHIRITLSYKGCSSPMLDKLNELTRFKATQEHQKANIEQQLEGEKKKNDTNQRTIENLMESLTEKKKEIAAKEKAITDQKNEVVKSVERSFKSLADNHVTLPYEVHLLITENGVSRPTILVSTEDLEEQPNGSPAAK